MIEPSPTSLGMGDLIATPLAGVVQRLLHYWISQRIK